MVAFNRSRIPGLIGAVVIGLALTLAGSSASAVQSGGPTPKPVVSDTPLARSLPGGFRSSYARVNGVRLHYVAGGQGRPLVLLPGWPETWWEFHKIMPELAERYRVIAVDLRGMGGSAKPQDGYDKKTMAKDIQRLVRHLGYEKVNVAGHDIGAMVAYSFAANHPEATDKVAMMDVAHPDDSMYGMTMVPRPGQKPEPSHGYLWWFAFNQVEGLPEQLVSGRSRYLVDWLFSRLVVDQKAISGRDRRLYAKAYSYPDAIRGGNGWYKAFPQDIVDEKAYGKVTAPLLGLGGSHSNYAFLKEVLPTKGTDVKVAEVKNSGHFIPEEQPEAVIRQLTDFLG